MYPRFFLYPISFLLNPTPDFLCPIPFSLHSIPILPPLSTSRHPRGKHHISGLGIIRKITFPLPNMICVHVHTYTCADFSLHEQFTRFTMRPCTVYVSNAIREWYNQRLLRKASWKSHVANYGVRLSPMMLWWGEGKGWGRWPQLRLQIFQGWSGTCDFFPQERERERESTWYSCTFR